MRGLRLSAATKLLDRLERPKQTSTGRWIAKCPAHGDRSPSLSVRELEDGRVLVHCFAGCPTELVLQALGLDFGDLFEKPLAHHVPPVRRGFSARELLELSAYEVTVAALLVSDAQTRELTSDERKRLVEVASRLDRAQELVPSGTHERNDPRRPLR
jgi:hypothetical protein